MPHEPAGVVAAPEWASESVVIERHERDGDASVRSDDLIVEAPMTIVLDGITVATTMRTPGADFELAAGFCFTEGLLDGHPILDVGYRTAQPGGSVVVVVSTGGLAPPPSVRLGNVSSSCGWCGSDQIDALCANLGPVTSRDPIDAAIIARIPDVAAASQPLFGATGAAHAAVAFDRLGTVMLCREDVGRHNAVDKVIGRFVLDGVTFPVAEGLLVSGRASIEMVQKAWAAGFSTLVSVSAPTALAVESARRAGMALAGFARNGGFNLYSPAPSSVVVSDFQAHGSTSTSCGGTR